MFSHEKDVRLLSRFKYPNDNEQGEKHFSAFLLAYSEDFREKHIKETAHYKYADGCTYC